MSQPKTTLQKPKPPSAAPRNLSLCRYLPRSTPSMSATATFTFCAGERRMDSITCAAEADPVAMIAPLLLVSRPAGEVGGKGPEPPVVQAGPPERHDRRDRRASAAWPAHPVT